MYCVSFEILRTWNEQNSVALIQRIGNERRWWNRTPLNVKDKSPLHSHYELKQAWALIPPQPACWIKKYYNVQYIECEIKLERI